ncbi:uncharacterized protein FFB20_10980 [Fusarium fujikuroi]|nr:Uncharacterized protein Y057_8995 [Fusarium fujikuroi]SCN99738.1 uncharacterized protein FFB20_10980 [Fusarium fujikuroi]SCO24353.1 uncharacterized protein FFE2_15939 [Fusarium fujikuroi]SCO25532.1 uncharacterized protein FFC1_15571 [Fusarium fujikuroi]SCO54029.1 uncharacterized protein FFNC_15300 [Fusarium fujikuroi]
MAVVDAPQWALSENAAAVLEPQYLRRIEVDDALTPYRTAAQLDKQEVDQQLDKESTRSKCAISPLCSGTSENAETGIEPLHPHKLVSPATAREALEKSAIPVEISTDKIDLVAVSKIASWNISKRDPVASDDECIMGINDISEASPDNPLRLPPRNPARLFGKVVQTLPPLPEIVVTPADKTQIESLDDDVTFDSTHMRTKEEDKFIYLKSTPYTLTQPSFRHGLITLSLARLDRGAKTTDDTLDWTAFQMAILGGAGELFQDTSCEVDIRQAEDITLWFDTFGFETYGELITEDVAEGVLAPWPSTRLSPHSTQSSAHPTIDNEASLPIPVSAEFPSGFWNAPAPGQAFDKAKFFSSTGLKRWVGEGGPKRPSFHSSEESLPPSPMMELVVRMDDVEGGISDTVPMGYNLGHDLGDFLKWQLENMVCI